MEIQLDDRHGIVLRGTLDGSRKPHDEITRVIVDGQEFVPKVAAPDREPARPPEWDDLIWVAANLQEGDVFAYRTSGGDATVVYSDERCVVCCAGDNDRVFHYRHQWVCYPGLRLLSRAPLHERVRIGDKVRHRNDYKTYRVCTLGTNEMELEGGVWATYPEFDDGWEFVENDE